MPTVADRHVAYPKPIPQVRRRPVYFPGLIRLPGGGLRCLFAPGKVVARLVDPTMDR